MQDKDAGGDENARILHRLIFFSDAVFAIVLTLMVLELRPPPGNDEAVLVEGLRALAPHLFSFVLTFAVVGVFWAAHMAYTRRLVVFDWFTAWINLAYLFVIALTPFASAMLGEHGNHEIAWRLYCGVLILASLVQTALWLAMSRGQGRLMGGVGWRERAQRSLRGLSPAVAFGAGYASLMAGRGDFVMWCWVLIPLVTVLADALFGPRRPRPA